jgi:Mg-chelatase subunit ChlD
VGISFERPMFLILAIPLLAFTLIPWFKLSKTTRRSGKHVLSLTLRIICIVLTTLLLSGFMTVKQTKKTSVIILADLSDSTRHVRQQMNNYVRDAVEHADKETRIGLMTFGYDTVYELPLTTDLRFVSFETSPQGNHTNLANAIIMANAMMPSDTNRRIIILTDGKQTIGDALESARQVAAQGVRIDAILLETGTVGKEVQVNKINLPETLYVGEEFELVVEIESNYKADAVLRLFDEQELKTVQNISLQEGINKFVFTDVATAPGVKNYRVEIETKEDDILRNNRMYSYIRVLGTPRLLIIDGTGNESHEFVKILGDTANYDVVSPRMAPTTLENLRKYESVVMMNVSKSDLPQGFDDMLEQYVRQLGRGLLTVGGDESYALGGWADSTLEKILPVNVYQRDEGEIASLALVILIDNSGSMQSGHNSPLELAKEGAARAVRSLKNIDEVGVIAFSDNAKRIVEMTSGEDKDYVINRIARIPSGGGTMMYTAMEMAYNDLVNSDKAVKHVILLSDGNPADKGFDKIAQMMKEKNITLTTIAIGGSANVNLLASLARITEGRIYKAVNAKDLPDIMLQETFLAMGEYLNNKTFIPSLVQSSPVVKGITSFTQLHGYIGTELKDAATLVLASDDDRPIYAEWQYGLGFVASYTSDLNGKWSKTLLEWDKGQDFILNMVSRILPQEEDPDLGRVETSKSGDKGHIKAILNTGIEGGEDNIETIAQVISPSGKEINVPLTLSGLGVYEGDFVLEEEGNYLINVVQYKDGKVILSKESAIVSSYSDEYDAFLKSGEVINTVVSNANGEVWDNIHDILKIKLLGAKEYIGYTLPLLILIIIILLIDITIRRLQFGSFIRAITQKSSAGVEMVRDVYTTRVKPKVFKPESEEKQKVAKTDKKVKEKKDFGKEAEEKKPTTSVSSLLEVKETKGRKKL